MKKFSSLTRLEKEYISHLLNTDREISKISAALESTGLFNDIVWPEHFNELIGIALSMIGMPEDTSIDESIPDDDRFCRDYYEAKWFDCLWVDCNFTNEEYLNWVYSEYTKT